MFRAFLSGKSFAACSSERAMGVMPLARIDFTWSIMFCRAWPTGAKGWTSIVSLHAASAGSSSAP
ncbi:MAG: hypothetical protein BWY85_01239 [Firmicutes bacterium ADurb.Bin506]|nr:MAG: hypothetical protein BWY85_01239 [Firmicutes bacterium ADurb.Bin506]